MPDSLRPRGLQLTRLPCSSLSTRIYSNSCPLSWWCHPTISSSVVTLLLPPSIFPSIRALSNELALHIRWPTYWSFSFSISPSNEYSGLISFRIDWFDIFAVQGTHTSLLQHHSWKASAFGALPPSHSYVTAGKTIAFTVWAFVSKVMSWLYNTLSRFLIAFLPKSKRFLISWLQSWSKVILSPIK